MSPAREGAPVGDKTRSFGEKAAVRGAEAKSFLLGVWGDWRRERSRAGRAELLARTLQSTAIVVEQRLRQVVWGLKRRWRGPASMADARTQPDFLIIGAQKAGTTWAYAMLKAHPGVFMPEQKEPEFFSHAENNHRERYVREYLPLFHGAHGSQRVGEATPSYFWAAPLLPEWEVQRPSGFEPDIPGAVFRLAGPDVKLVLFLRDPVERAISAYLHHVKYGRFPAGASILSVGKYLGIIGMGFYHRHLQAWTAYYPRSQFLVLLFEEAMRDKEGALQALYRFVGVNPRFRPLLTQKRRNPGMERTRENGAVYVTVDGERQRVVSREEIAALRQIFSEDVRQLSQVLGRDLAQVWWNA